jgi:hypothetical protein
MDTICLANRFIEKNKIIKDKILFYFNRTWYLSGDSGSMGAVCMA